MSSYPSANPIPYPEVVVASPSANIPPPLTLRNQNNGYLSTWSNYFQDLTSSQETMALLGITATIGIGSAAAFYFGNRRRSDGIDPSKKKSRVGFKNEAGSSESLKEATKSKSDVTKSEPKTKDENANKNDVNGNNSEVTRTEVNVRVIEVEKFEMKKREVEKNEVETITTPSLDFSSKFQKEISALKSPPLDENGNPIVRMVEYSPVLNNVLVLKQCPRGRKTPCIAPFPLKLETFLRVHKIKYEVDFNDYEPKVYDSPWIRFNTEDVTESQNVIQFLVDSYGIKSEKMLTGEQRAMTTAYTHLLENHLYWGVALWRWVYDGARSLKEIQLLPKTTQKLIPDVCKTVEQAAWFHGIGKMTPDEVRKAVIKDLGSLSEFLGNKKYFLDTELPTELDCTAFGMLAQILWNMKGPFHDAVYEGFRNLREFCWRIRLEFWPDWEDCLNNTEFYSEEPYPTADFYEYPFER